jgi:membrane protein implicated in regulation of membrane protease activity
LSSSQRSIPVFARYWLFQLPGMFLALLVLAVLVHWELITMELAAVLFGFWVLKDLAMFPFLRVGYELEGRPAGADALVGAVGVVREPLSAEREGWVRLGPELWRAVSPGDGEVPAGARVRVVSVQGLVLRVEREEA